VIRDDSVFITTFGAPSSVEDGVYLMLQHKDKYSAQDVKLGMHLPYIEFLDQGWSWYGHILEFTLGRSNLTVELDGEAAQRMENDGKIEVAFNLSQAQFQELRSALQETFKGYAYFQEQA